MDHPAEWRNALELYLRGDIDARMTEMSDEDIDFPWMNSEIRNAMARAAVNVLEAVAHYEAWITEQGGLDEHWLP